MPNRCLLGVAQPQTQILLKARRERDGLLLRETTLWVDPTTGADAGGWGWDDAALILCPTKLGVNVLEGTTLIEAFVTANGQYLGHASASVSVSCPPAVACASSCQG